MKTTRRKKRQNHHQLSLGDSSLLTYQQAADRLGVSLWTFRHWVYEGRIDAIAFTQQIKRVSIHALDRFIAENTMEAR